METKEGIPYFLSYLENIEKILIELEVKRQIFLDFDRELKKQKAKWNPFIIWTINNYHKIMVLNICKLIEPRKDDKHKYTLRHFIHTLNEKKGQIKEEIKNISIPVQSIETGEIRDFYIGTEKVKEFDKLNLDNDLEILDEFLKKIKPYRDKELCHNDINKDYDYKDIPGIIELNDFIDKLEKMMLSYYQIFGISVDYTSFKIPGHYHNFTLYLD